MARFEHLNVHELFVDLISGPGAPQVATSGNKYYVDSVHGAGGADGLSWGSARTKVFGTNGALALCESARGDVIYVAAGHSETMTSAGQGNKTGVSIVCIGNGLNRPVFTVNAAIPGLNMAAANCKIYNARIIAGSAVTAATRLLRIAADCVEFIRCRFEMAYDMYHMIVVLSGDAVRLIECEYVNTVTTNASIHPQTAVLNVGGTDTQIIGGRFMDVGAKKAERWRACVEGGKLTGRLTVEKALFICRGIATRTRSAAASGLQFTIDCRGISPSSNTSVGAIFTPTFQHIIETYNIAAVNKIGVVTTTT